MRASVYEVYEPSIKIRIGEHNEDLERFLIEQGEECWMFITAHNPGSEKMSDEENAERNSSMLAELNPSKVYRGRGIGDSQNWYPEESYLVLGISRAETTALAKKYGHNAIVFGNRKGLRELVLIK